MKFPTLLTLLFTGICVLPASAEVVNAYYRYMETPDFQHVKEFFVGEEISGDRLIVRSRPDDRDGIYFIIELDQAVSALRPDSRIVLEWIRSDRKEAESLALPLAASDTRYIYFGLTGADWPNDSLRPVAWRISIEDLESNVTAEWKSFLWEMP